MKLEVKEVQERVTAVETERAQYNVMAADWEALWRMDVWEGSWKDSLQQKGQEQVTLPTTYDTVNLAQRLFSSIPKIEVPTCHPTKEGDGQASKRERWLRAMWNTVDYQQKRSVVSDLVWQSLVRGRHCVEVKWVREELPEKLRNKRFPILIRTLDPMNCGFRYGPLWTEYAFHKYRQNVSLVVQRYPELRKLDTIKAKLQRAKWVEEEIEIVDYWYTSFDGSIWNCVLAGDTFIKKPVKTDYPDIPLIEGYADSAPLEGEAYKGLSILHPMRDLYRYQCRLASQLATGVMYYFWPMMMVQNDNGFEPNDFTVKPGQITFQPQGTKIDQVSPQPNVPLAQAVMSMMEAQMQQASFPGVLYGESPGSLQAGYGVSLLSDAAKGRVNQTRFNLERTMEQVNMLALGLVEAMADGPVAVWGKNERSSEMYNVELAPEDINGFYENKVTITPAIPSDTMQTQTLGLRQIEAGVVSRRTYRDKFMDITVPEDEAVRVEIEKALMSEALSQKVTLEMLQSYFPDDWQRMIAGTPLEQLAQAQEQAEKERVMQEVKGKFGGTGPIGPEGPMGPNGPMMPMLPPGGPMPPMPPGMPPGGPMGPGGVLPPGGPIQPPSMNMDAGTIGPEQQGQLTPELLGLGPNVDPIMFAQMMGNPLPPGEELNKLGGQ